MADALFLTGHFDCSRRTQAWSAAGRDRDARKPGLLPAGIVMVGFLLFIFEKPTVASDVPWVSMM